MRLREMVGRTFLVTVTQLASLAPGTFVAPPCLGKSRTMEASEGCKRCELCAAAIAPRSKQIKSLVKDLGISSLPGRLLTEQCCNWRRLTDGEPLQTGVVHIQKCFGKVKYALSLDAKEMAASAAALATRSGVLPSDAPPPRKRNKLGQAAELRFGAASVLRPARRVPLSAEWSTAAAHIAKVVDCPDDAARREQAWRMLAHEPPVCTHARRRQPLTWYEEVCAMGPDDLGPPLLTTSQLLPFNDDVGDGYDPAREQLLHASKCNVLHEVEIIGHALDQLDCQGNLVSEHTRCLLDEEVTRYRNQLRDCETLGPLFQRFGWANPDKPKTCKLLRHPAHVPLLVTERHKPVADLAVGADGFAPVLMYCPSLPKMLPDGHPGRVALEMLLPADDSDESWLACKLPLPPDHSMAGWTLRAVLLELPAHGKAHGHGHGFERLSASGTSGGSSGVCWVPSNKRGSKQARVQRPLISDVVLEWNNASSALQHGVVNACIPAAEALLNDPIRALLPPDHPCRMHRTRLAPYGWIFSYQASKWYVSRQASESYLGLIKYEHGKIDSFDASSSKARTIEPHFDTGNTFYWGLCIIFGRFSGFEQTYPTLRILLECDHLSFVIGPYGQLSHAVAQGEGSEPRCCVLLHLQ